ncbi:MAG TPA: site-specific integrase, partial [Polyangiaceae bacterium]
NLVATTKRRSILASNYKGLILRVSIARGKPQKVFLYRYWKDGEAYYATLGPYPTLTLAQAEVLRANCKAAHDVGRDPKAVVAAYWAGRTPKLPHESSGGPTVNDVVKEFLTHYAARERKRPEQAKYLLEANVTPVIGSMAAADVKKRDIVTMLDGIVARGSPVVANRVQALLKQAFAVAADRDLIESVPTFPRAAAGGEEKVRTRTLSDNEIALFWHGMDSMTQKVKFGKGLSRALVLALKLVLITAQRRGEIAAARWDDILVETTAGPKGKPVVLKSWHIRDTKSDRPHLVPLSPLAVSLLDDLKALAGKSEYWLPSALGTNATADRDRTITRAAREVRTRLLMAPWTPHDLRRTARTGLSRLGVLDAVAERVLNHVAGDRMIAVYNQHRYLDEMRVALDQWSSEVEKIVRREFAFPAELKDLER